MYAVVETGGKQYRVEKGSTLLVDRLPADEGSKVSLRPVALLDKTLVTGEDLEKVKVEAKVAEHVRGPKIRVFKYRPKKGYRRTQGHRSELTRLEVTELKLLQRKPPQKSETRPSAKRSASSGGSSGETAKTKKESSDGS
jgi:large subunit ribosomal protein L21